MPAKHVHGKSWGGIPAGPGTGLWSDLAIGAILLGRMRIAVLRRFLSGKIQGQLGCLYY